MRYSLRFIENGWSFGFGYFANTYKIKRGLVVSFLFWELAIGVGRTEEQNINTLWN